MMPPLDQAGALLSSPVAAGCGGDQSWLGSVLTQWSILLTLRNRKRPQRGEMI